MPVSLSVVNHEAKSWDRDKVETPEGLFEKACPKQFRRSKRVIRNSFSATDLIERHISPSENGFVWAAYHAYSNHHHLTIRPEDVWFSILTQASFYINANAEKLRSFFVAHEGQKELQVSAGGTLETANFGALAEAMTEQISKNVNDPELRTWIMPSFTTTTDSDRVVASVLFMGAMQKYFSYSMMLTCGIPSVTLLGELSDWEDMHARLDKLELLGDEATRFAQMLKPILRHMILSFKEPTSPDVIRFWNTIATHNPVGSGSPFISGWISAFCFWDQDGRPKTNSKRQVVLDGVSYPTVDLDDVPVGFASVPVSVNDNGSVHKCTMLAGSLGIQASSYNGQDTAAEYSVEASVSPSGTAIRPLSGWLMYENEGAEAAEEREKEQKELEDKLQSLSDEPRSEGSGWDSERWEKQMKIMRRLEELQSF